MSEGVLVVAETAAGGGGEPVALQPVTYELLGAGRRLRDGLGGGPLSALLLGDGTAGLAAGVAAHGAERVYVADAPALASYLAETYVPVLAAAVAAAAPRAVLLAHSASGRE